MGSVCRADPKTGLFNCPRCSPSPQPPPSGRGSVMDQAGECAPPGDRSRAAKTPSLSPGERVRVRGKTVFNCIDSAKEMQRRAVMSNRPNGLFGARRLRRWQAIGLAVLLLTGVRAGAAAPAAPLQLSVNCTAGDVNHY